MRKVREVIASQLLEAKELRGHRQMLQVIVVLVLLK